MKHLTIAETATEDRPRERLENFGANALSNAELLAIVLRSGTKNVSVVELAKRIMHYFDNSLTKLASATHAELVQINGIGPAKAAEILAAFTLARRLKTTLSTQPLKITTPLDAADYFRERLKLLSQEEFHVMLLDTKNRILKSHLITKGLLNKSQIHAREVFRYAIHHNCHKIIVAHNHPSGDPSPSREDIEVTERLKEAGEIVGIELADHIIIGMKRCHGSKDYTSFLEDGLI